MAYFLLFKPYTVVAKYFVTLLQGHTCTSGTLSALSVFLLFSLLQDPSPSTNPALPYQNMLILAEEAYTWICAHSCMHTHIHILQVHLLKVILIFASGMNLTQIKPTQHYFPSSPKNWFRNQCVMDISHLTSRCTLHPSLLCALRAGPTHISSVTPFPSWICVMCFWW